jgi:hypothetical protein
MLREAASESEAFLNQIHQPSGAIQGLFLVILQERERHTERDRERQTDGEGDRQRERQRDRDKERQREESRESDWTERDLEP